MASFQNRKSTAPPPPPLSQLWQMATTATSFSNSDMNDDTQSVSTTATQEIIMNDEEMKEMNKMLARNGHGPTTHMQNQSSYPRKSITRKYNVPKPPLHATHAIINEKSSTYNHLDQIVKNNPYRNKQKKKTRILHSKHHNHKHKVKRTIRPVNAKLNINKSNTANNNNNNTNNNTTNPRTSYYKSNNVHSPHTITNMDHHRKESKTIDIFLRNRMTETELHDKNILPSNIESNDEAIHSKQFWDDKHKQREQIKNKLTKRLSKSFRPEQEDLYDRGIYITNPKDKPEYAAWNHANTRRRNSRSLANKFNNRPAPNEVLNKGYIKQADFRELFDDKYRPQTQPPTPTYDDDHHDLDIMNTIEEQTQHVNRDRLNNKIAHRLTVNEMKRRGIMYEDPAIPAGLQKRKRELHRRRASAKLEEFLLRRPKAETLKRRHIMISARDKYLEEKSAARTKQKLVSHIVKDKKRRRKKGKIWITQGQLIESKRRESIKISDFLLRRPAAEKLVRKHILPSIPYAGGYDEIKSDFKRAIRAKQRIIDKLFSKPTRADLNELERRGYVPAEYISDGNHINHDFETAQFEYKRRRKQSRTDLEKQLINRPPMKELINNHIMDPNEINIDDINQYHKRRKSQKLDFRKNLNDKFEQRPEIDQVPYKYFMPQNDTNDIDEKVIDTANLKLDIVKTPPPATANNKRGVKRKRIEKTAKSRASLVLEQFLPVRPEIQQLWDKNILPSLPPSPHKQTSFHYQKSKTKAIGGGGINAEYESLFGFATLQQTPSPLQQMNKNIIKENSISPIAAITPQTLYINNIDKRHARRQDSMAQLELRLLDRAPRESLFELGILIMSPAPSPPPLSVIQQTKQSLPADINNHSIFEDEKEEELMNHNGMGMRKRRKLMNGNYKNQNKHKKKSSLVLDEYLGSNVAAKLDSHLYNRPDPSELIARGIVPTYSFSKKSIYDTPSKFAKHRRNMTLELQHRLENKLRNRPLLNDLPIKIYAVNDSVKQLYVNNKISYMEQSEIQNLLNSMRESHEKSLEELKARYWSLLVEEKDRYQQFESITNKTNALLRRKLEALQNECQSLSTLLIRKNTQLKEQSIEFKQRLIRLNQEHNEQYLRQEQIIKLSNDNQRELRQEMNEKANNQNQNQNQNQLIDIQFLFENIYPNKINDDDLRIMREKIATVENKYCSDLQRERSMHRKFNEQSERVKQTLVDEINKMELQHQNKLHNLENQIVTLKEENRSIQEKKNVEIKKLKQKLSAEIEKERNIATIMVEDLDEEKTRLIQEMDEMKTQFDKKLKIQKEQINQLRQVAEDAVFYGNKSTDINNNLKYKKLKQSKENLEEKVLLLTQEILNHFQHNLNHNILQEINLKQN